MSEIRVDTISEKTSANGVAVDGVTLKDGGITISSGSIGVVNSDNPFFQGTATDHGGLQCGTNNILPCKSGSNADATLDLGIGDVRWKDLYLSGGAFIGGNGTANLLDDYEEGTFTPTLVSSGATFGYTHQKGFYTKIGNAVTFNIHFQLDGGSNSFSANAVTITGLPFTSANVSGQLYRFYTFGRLVDVQGTGATGIVSSLIQNATTISILESGDNVAGNALNSNQLSSSSGQLFVQGTYYV